MKRSLPVRLSYSVTISTEIKRSPAGVLGRRDSGIVIECYRIRQAGMQATGDRQEQTAVAALWVFMERIWLSATRGKAVIEYQCCWL